MIRFHALLAVLAFGCGGTEEPRRASSPAPRVPSTDPAAEPRECPGAYREAPAVAVLGQHRGCEVDADCASVRLDCSNLRCTAVNRTHEDAYSAPIDCSGYSGVVGNYDCMPRFHAEQPVCVDGCCMSERRGDRLSAEDACNAIGEVYERESCTVFGPSFATSQCLGDVAAIREEANEAQLRRLQIGLDCAVTISSCVELSHCVAEYRGEEEDG